MLANSGGCTPALGLNEESMDACIIAGHSFVKSNDTVVCANPTWLEFAGISHASTKWTLCACPPVIGNGGLRKARAQQPGTLIY